MNRNNLPHAIIVFCILAIGFIISGVNWIKHDQIPPNDSVTTSPLYSMSSTGRNSILYQMVEAKEYQTVINATDDGIQNHRDLVWNDVAFWGYRARAYYELGNCTESIVAAYHASMIDTNDPLLSIISNSPTCSKALKK